MKSIKPLSLSLAAVAASLGTNAMAGTILVDVTSADILADEAAISTAADFAAFDSNVDLAADVFNVFSTENLTNVAITGGTGDLSSVTIASTGGLPFTTNLNESLFAANPILSDFGGRGTGGPDITVNLVGLGDVAPGSLITLSVFGANANDAGGQNNFIVVDYNGEQQSQGNDFPDVVDPAIPLAAADAVVQFTFTAVEGVDELSFFFDGNGAEARNFAGFSLTSVAVPEPASMALVGLGSLALMGRRRQA